MFCPKCGKEIFDDAEVCIHCGRAVKEKTEEKPQNKDYNQPKTGIGVVMALFLGVIGLVIGIAMYPENTVARKTFMKAWGITFGVCIGVSILSYVIYFIIIFAVGASSATFY